VEQAGRSWSTLEEEIEVSEGKEGLRNAGLAIIAVGVILAGLVYGRHLPSAASSGTCWRR
jgi:hypothetical protein